MSPLYLFILFPAIHIVQYSIVKINLTT